MKRKAKAAARHSPATGRGRAKPAKAGAEKAIAAAPSPPSPKPGTIVIDAVAGKAFRIGPGGGKSADPGARYRASARAARSGMV